MKARSLLLALFAGSLILICLFTFVAFQIILDIFGSLLPETVSFGGISLPALWIIYANAALLYLLIAFLFVFLYLTIARLIISPVKTIGAAMHEFAEHGRQMEMPPLDRSISEVSHFVDAFREYTDSVERVHERDMEVSRMKSDFISTAAHQLRTPMTGIRWALEALQKTPLSPDQQVLIDSAVGKSHDLVTIIGTLLDISAIESGKYKYKFEPVDMSGVLDEVVRDFTPLAQTRQVTLYYAKNEVPLAKAKADVERVKWVLNNLIENAIRYTPASGTVQVSMEGAMGRIFLHVKDTGIGIKEGDRSSIFERFYRAQNAIQKENSGNGLGLYIARTIAKDHGGDLNFEANKEGPGTTFTLSLPVAN